MAWRTLFLVLLLPIIILAQDVIRVNGLGYQETAIKRAVYMKADGVKPSGFEVYDAVTDMPVYKGALVSSIGSYGSFNDCFYLDFSDWSKRGSYYLKADGIVSPIFVIDDGVYNGSADVLLQYMRQQRCGFNSTLNDSCHTHDGFIIYHPTRTNEHINVIGGWHDASDYLQYVTTSANAVFQMLLAYFHYPESFSDQYNRLGLPGRNGVPDILDEVKWGLEWLLRMNPEKGVMFNQIADDRDHRGFRLPNQDTVSYGKGLERPVYFCTGEPQGLMKNKNRATGIASTAGKYAAAFAFGAKIFAEIDPLFARICSLRAISAYEHGKAYPGVCQTAPCSSPYFYEEDNWTDDMELGAALLYSLTSDVQYMLDAIKYGESEPVTPWMGADTASHYQWYPFHNVGHYFLSYIDDSTKASQFTGFLRDGLQKIKTRGERKPFKIGVPFIWCSNNLVAAALTQSRLYTRITGDTAYEEMEASLRDWLFGCNPWGTSMLIGYPKYNDTPADPHSAFTALHNIPIDGGLVDGPVYNTIYSKLIGIKLYNPDEYAPYQSDYVVYHDDYGDYSTNEPTMDGTASLSFYFASLQNDGGQIVNPHISTSHSAVIRGDSTQPELSLVFTGHEFADGGETILKVLKKHDVKASFFLTGDFYRNPDYNALIKALKADGHYLGAHSDKHLLYADWEKRDSTLLTKTALHQDIKDNYKAMAAFGISHYDAPYFLPPYEWYNEEIAAWTSQLGLKLINFTPGTKSHADWTIPSMNEKYTDSETIFKSIIDYDNEYKHSGLNGFILLSHIGTHPERTDKFYNKLDALIETLVKRGYALKRVDQLAGF